MHTNNILIKIIFMWIIYYNKLKEKLSIVLECLSRPSFGITERLRKVWTRSHCCEDAFFWSRKIFSMSCTIVKSNLVHYDYLCGYAILMDTYELNLIKPFKEKRTVLLEVLAIISFCRIKASVSLKKATSIHWNDKLDGHFNQEKEVNFDCKSGLPSLSVVSNAS